MLSGKLPRLDRRPRLTPGGEPPLPARTGYNRRLLGVVMH